LEENKELPHYYIIFIIYMSNMSSSQNISLINELNILEQMIHEPEDKRQKKKIGKKMKDIKKIILNKTFIPNEIQDDNTALLIALRGYISILNNSDIYDYITADGTEDFFLELYKNIIINLIESGESTPGHISKYGTTALILSCNYKLEEIAFALIETGESNPGYVSNDENEYTALILACSNDLPEVALALIKTGKSNPGHVSKNDGTALLWACHYDRVEVALALIETDESNPGYVDDQGMTALIYACVSELSDVALALIETGESNPQHKNKKGQDALYFARLNHMDDVIDALTETESPTMTYSSQSIDISKNGFNAIELESRNIGEYLRENKNHLALMVNNQVFLIDKKSIKIQLKNKTYIKYGCFQAGENKYDENNNIIGINYISDDNINFDVRYFSMGSIFGMQFLVNEKEVRKIIRENNKHQMYVIESTPIILPAIISEAFIDGEYSASADHCQTGKATNVYSIQPALQAGGKNKTKTRRRGKRNISKNKKENIRKTKKVKIRNI
jgi:ankyrin repeat protein